MARFINILVFSLMLAACAKSDDKAPVTCEMQFSPETVTYPDGEARKSDVYRCSDGCVEYRFVNDPNVKFNTCEVSQ